MSLCKYKDIAGKPKEGIHSYRLFDIAIVDVIGTVLIGMLINVATGWNVWLCIIAMFVLGIIAHRLFCVNTKINTMIFGELKP